MSSNRLQTTPFSLIFMFEGVPLKYGTITNTCQRLQGFSKILVLDSLRDGIMAWTKTMIYSRNILVFLDKECWWQSSDDFVKSFTLKKSQISENSLLRLGGIYTGTWNLIDIQATWFWNWILCIMDIIPRAGGGIVCCSGQMDCSYVSIARFNDGIRYSRVPGRPNMAAFWIRDALDLKHIELMG